MILYLISIHNTIWKISVTTYNAMFWSKGKST